MKNPRKSVGIATGSVVTGGLTFFQEEIENFPIVIKSEPSLQETTSPEEESFRAFLQTNLPRHTAPQALEERIKRSIKNMPD